VRWFAVALTVASSACTSQSLAIVKSADRQRAMGLHEAAERTYERALARGLTRAEWERVRNDLCATRKERITTLARRGQLEKLSDNQLADELVKVRKCHDLFDVDLQLSSIQVERVFARMDEAVAPLVAAKQHWEAVQAAAGFMKTLPSKNARTQWFEDLQREARRQLEAAITPDAGVLTGEVLLELAAFTGAAGSATVPDPRSTVKARLETPAVFAFATIAPACAGRVTTTLAPPPTTLPSLANDDVGVVAVLDGCRDDFALVDDTEDYQVEEMQTVKLKRTVYKTVTREMPGAVTTQRQVCGDILCHTYSVPPATMTERIAVEEEYEEQRLVTVTKQRPIKRVQRRQIATLLVRSIGADGEQTTRVDVEVKASIGRYEPTQTTLPRDVTGFPEQTAELSQLVAGRAHEAARQLARELRGQRWATLATRAFAAGDRTLGVELSIAAWLAGHQLSVARQQDLARALPLAGKTIALPYAPRDLRTLTYADKPIPVNGYAFLLPFAGGVLTQGYAPVGMSLLAQTDRAPSIAGQPDRRTARASFGMFADLVAVLSPEPNGFTVYAPAGYNFELGARTSDAYRFPGPSSASKTEETVLALGIELYAGALVGYRSRRFGLLGGAMATYQGHMIGAFRSSSGQLPLMARFEYRRSARFPWVLELWGLDVAGGDEFTRGARLDIPIGTALWLRAQLRETRAESQTLGINHEDFVALGVQDLVSFSAGFVSSF